MAVFQAARARSSALAPREARIAVPRARSTTRTFVRPRLIAEASIAVPRVRPAAMLVGVVLLAALIGFAYLTQTLSSTTRSVEIDQLVAEQQSLKQVIAAREPCGARSSEGLTLLDRIPHPHIHRRQVRV